MADEKIIDLLRKLMAQAEGEKAVGNLAAAEAFAAKAQELLTKMRIDQLTKATEEKFDELFPNTVSTGGSRFYNHSGFEAGEQYGSAVGINGTKRLGA